MQGISPFSYLSVLPLLGRYFAQIAKQVAQAQRSTGSKTQGSSATDEKSGSDQKSTFEAAYEKEKKRCRTTTLGSKLAYYTHCLDEAKRRLKNPPKPTKPKTELEQELASCEMRGKPSQIWQCKQDAPKRIEQRHKAAAEWAAYQSKYTPLERALNGCSNYSKAIQIWQCRDDAKKKYGSGK